MSDNTNYEKQRESEKQSARQLAIADAHAWIEKIPTEKRRKAAIVVGTRSFTPEELIKEIEADTEYGKQFSNMLHLVRLELAKKGG